MVRSELLGEEGILLVTPDGPLEAADFERLTKEVEPFIAANGRLSGLLINAEFFPGWDSFGALLSHLRFVADHHRKIARIAVVTDSALLKVMPQIAEHFVQAEIKQFRSVEQDQALAWLAD
jgi:hypothetical protein